MKLLRKSVIVVSILMIQAACASPSRTITSTDFSDFNTLGDANWSFNGSEARANQGNGFLVSKESYDDFYLKVEFLAGQGSNSGIFIRCEDAAKINDQNCYEANIFDKRPDQTYRTGSITGHVAPKTLINTEDGNWHTYEIFAVGEKISILLDGKEVVYMRDKNLSVGHVAFQFAQGEIAFRNYQIKPLSRLALESKKTVLDGVWELESMDIVDRDGNSTPWCKGSFGVIIYTNNYMSTAVNCTSDPSKSVLYSGPFTIKGQVAFHHVQNYSDSNLYKVFSREFQLKDNNNLELKGSLGENTVIVRWIRR